MPDVEDAPTRRRRSGLLALGRSQALVGLLVGALAFAVTVQVNQGDDTDYSTLRGVELVELLKSIDAANERLGGQVDELTRTRDGLLSSQGRAEDAERAAEDRAGQLAVLAGSAGATGPGVRLTVQDPDGIVDAALLLDTVQELRDAGAEAIVVNETARVVAQTYFLDEQDAVRVGGREVTSPYVIEVIGDPETLGEAVSFRGGTVDRFANRGAEVLVERDDTITITALADVTTPEYSRPESDDS